MRLICPNCDAHYEVDTALIPPAGRDVQCSDCGHVWFQDGVGNIPIPDPTPPAETEPPAPAEPDAEEVAPPDPDPEIAPEEGVEENGLRPLAQRSLDDTLLSVLREEAEREAEARAREGSAPVETQPDLGLTEADAGPRRRIIVRAPSGLPDAQDDANPPDDEAAESHAADGEDAPQRPSRRELLPDIEQINSTLRASGAPRRAGEAGEEELQLPEPVQKRRRGFRIGFLGILLIAALAVSIYVSAALIKTMVPALGPALDTYVTQIDALRHELDRVLQSLLHKLEQSSGP